MSGASVPAVALDPEQAERLRRITARREALDAVWRDEVRSAVASGASLREVADLAGISHTAVKFIAHGRPVRGG